MPSHTYESALAEIRARLQWLPPPQNLWLEPLLGTHPVKLIRPQRRRYRRII